jgi:hypothetical protein
MLFLLRASPRSPVELHSLSPAAEFLAVLLQQGFPEFTPLLGSGRIKLKTLAGKAWSGGRAEFAEKPSEWFIDSTSPASTSPASSSGCTRTWMFARGESSGATR